MYALEASNLSYWWIAPIIMMIICLLMMRGKRGSMMCGFGPRELDNNQTRKSDTAMEILDKRYASGEIGKEEYQERKRMLTDSTGHVDE
jgi:uncharacterized membrane protein